MGKKKWTPERFKDLVHSLPLTDTGCKLWPRCKSSRNYGTVRFNDNSWSTHRLSYFLFHGDFHPRLVICHKCDTPACVNPEHLYAGTHADNYQDAVIRGLIQYRKNNPSLTEDQIEFIRENYKLITMEDWAKIFNVSVHHINKIRSIGWKIYWLERREP